MKGKIVEREGILYVEYITVGVEADEVDKKQIRVSSAHRGKVSIGEEVDFECRSLETISDTEVAIIKNK